MRKQLDKKGQVFSQMQGLMVGLATVMIIAIVVFLIIAQARDQVASIENIGNLSAPNVTGCRGSIACNATNILANSATDAINFIPLIVIAAIGAVLLGLVALFRRSA